MYLRIHALIIDWQRIFFYTILYTSDA